MSKLEYGRKVLPVESALNLIRKALKEEGVSLPEDKLFDTLVRACPTIDADGVPCIRMDSLYGFFSNLQQALKYNDASWLFESRGIKTDRIVDVIEFAESKEFFGQKGYLRPAIAEHLYNVFHDPDHNFVEVVYDGGIGIGKNYAADISIGYMLYVLSCYYNPQVEFGLAPGSPMVFIGQSKTERLAKKVVFQKIANKIKASPYFQEHFPYNPNVNSELQFPNNISLTPVGGSDSAAMGQDVYGGLIDEINYMEVIRGSTQTVNAGPDEIYDQAESLYNTIKNRMVSRYNEQGSVPGKLFLVSSANYDDDFTDRKRKEMEEEIRDGKPRTIYVMKLAQWEALPRERLMDETFLVEVGNESKRSKIVASMEEATDREDVIEIPMDYYNSFSKDVDQALRDLGGIRTGTKRPFIPFKDEIAKAQDKFYAEVGDTGQLFLYDTVDMTNILQELEDGNFWKLVNQRYLDEVILDPSQVFAAHIDASLSGDALGFALGRIGGYTQVEGAKIYDDKNQDFIELGDTQVPIYRYDGLLQCVSGNDLDIDFEMIRDLVLFLSRQINLKWVTLDSFQSAMVIQSLKKNKIRSGVISMDTSIAPYEELKSAFKDSRVMFPPHSICEKELRELERDRKKNKVDHPRSGCFVGDTKIMLETGDRVPISQMADDWEQGIIHHVLTYDGAFTSAVAYRPHIEKYVSELVEIEMEDGTVFRCTPDHLLLLSNGKWVQASALTPDDDILSLE